MEPEKPFACTLPDCGMTFTNEDHLHVHTKKHDMVLQLGIEQKSAFVADQTPTPTRFIRNCEEVGLFQDLQNVNPFDEGFKRAMETKHGMLSLESSVATEDALHTPHLVFPLESGDCTLYTANNQRNITISRSSSDESGAVKEYETTTISKLTNEVTTISRVVGKDILDRVTTTDDVSIVRHEETARNKEGVNGTSVSYTNNVIKFHSNVEIRKDNINIDTKKAPLVNTDLFIKEPLNVDVLLDSKKDKVPPIMSQKSLDYVVDSLASDGSKHEDNLGKTTKCNFENNTKRNELPNVTSKDKNAAKLDEDYEVIIKLPNGKQVVMKAVDEIDKPVENNTKQKLNKILKNKAQKPVQRTQNIQNAIIQNIVPIAPGTFIPVTLMSSQLPVLQNSIAKIAIPPLTSVKRNFKAVKRKSRYDIDGKVFNSINKGGDLKSNKTHEWHIPDDSNTSSSSSEINKKNPKRDSESRSAASKRYRERLKQSMQRQNEENKHLRELNRRLIEEKALLQCVITQHIKKCPVGDELSNILQEKLHHITQDNSHI